MKKCLFIFALIIAVDLIAAPVRTMIGAKMSISEKGEPESYTAADYIQDGLVAMWDGIENAGLGEHDGKTTIWKDLSGNNHDIIFYKTPGGYACHTVYSDSMGGGYSGYAWGYNSSIPDNYWVTCELIFKVENLNGGSTRQNIIFGSNDRMFAVNLSLYNNTNDLQCILNSKVYVNRMFSMGEPSTIIGHKQSLHIVAKGTQIVAYFNGVAQVLEKENAVGWQNGRANISIGGENISNGMGRFFQGRIYALRLYDRVLSTAERAYNQKIDKARFDL